MTFGEKITMLRKQLKWSQEDLANKIGTSAPIVGRYERNEIKPSIEVAGKIADALDVTVDYLIGRSNKILFDKKLMKRIEDIENLNDEDKKHLVALMDAFLRDTKIKQAYANK